MTTCTAGRFSSCSDPAGRSVELQIRIDDRLAPGEIASMVEKVAADHWESKYPELPLQDALAGWNGPGPLGPPPVDETVGRAVPAMRLIPAR